MNSPASRTVELMRPQSESPQNSQHTEGETAQRIVLMPSSINFNI
jgi:hypothetical protein